MSDVTIHHGDCLEVLVGVLALAVFVVGVFELAWWAFGNGAPALVDVLRAVWGSM